MTREERAALLQQAKGLVDRVIADLDVSFVPCGTCGSNRLRNFTEAKDADILKGITGRIDRLTNPRRWVRDHEPQESA